MQSRRGFLGAAALAGAGALLPLLPPRGAAAGPDPGVLDPRRLRKFVEELPRPPRLTGPVLDIPVSEFRQQLHPDLPPTTLWGYAGTYPGPTIEAVRGQPLRVRWRSELEDPALARSLPVDPTLHWADPLGTGHSRARYEGPVPVVVHLHGGEVEPQSDGHPEAWFTRNFDRRGRSWAKEVYEYGNAQRAATLWYHDHALGITRLNIYAGLAGFYLLRDPEVERPLNLPSGDYEREILIQDRTLSPRGELLYPRAGASAAVHPFWVPEFFGSAIVVNGKLWPHMTVEPRKYRLRLLNGSNARFYTLRLSSGRPFIQIGTDGGLMQAPVEVQSLLLAPGERADVIVDFSRSKPGSTVLLRNNARAPFPGGEEVDAQTAGQVMQFRVVPLRGPDTSAVPGRLAPIAALGPASVTRTLTLEEQMGPRGPLAALLDGKTWSAPVTETPGLGATEIWEFVNLTMDSHPIHVHLVTFQVLNRQAFRPGARLRAPDLQRQLARQLVGRPRPPAPGERGWKDTVRANPGEVTRIIVRFGPGEGAAFPFDATAQPGYVWHCHILEHEDNEMMRPYRIVPRDAS